MDRCAVSYAHHLRAGGFLRMTWAGLRIGTHAERAPALRAGGHGEPGPRATKYAGRMRGLKRMGDCGVPSCGNKYGNRWIASYIGTSEIRLRRGLVLEKVVTALCMVLILWVVLFSGPMGEDGQPSGDTGMVAQLGH